MKFCIEREEAARGRLGNPPATLPTPTRWGLVNTLVRPTYVGGSGQQQIESVLGRYSSSQECEAARVQREASWLAAGGWRTGYGNTIANRIPETGSIITSTLACVEGR